MRVDYRCGRPMNVRILRHPVRVLSLFVAAAAVVSWGSLVGATGQSGGNEVISSNPTANQAVSDPPTQIQMVFRDALPSAESATDIRLVLACNGALVGLNAPQLAPDLKTVSVALTQIPETGLCTLSWSLADGSVGSFSFTSTATVESTTASGTGELAPTTVPAVIGEVLPERTGSGPRVGGLLGLLRVFEYLFVSALFGGLMLLVLAWPEGIDYGIGKRFFRLTWLLAVITTYLVVSISAMRQSDSGLGSALNPFSWFSAFNEVSGYVLILRFVLVVAFGWIATNLERVFDPTTQVPSMGIAIVMMATYGFTRLGQNVPVFTYLVGIVHALAVGLWVGALILLSRAVLVGPGDEDLLHAVRGMARLTTPLILVATVSGVFQVYLLDGFNIFTSGHGLLNVMKVLVVALMIWIALMLKVFTQGRLGRERQLSGKMAWRLRRAVGAEIMVGVFALVLTAWMVPMRPPQAGASSSTPATQYAFREELRNDRFHVIVSLTPGVVGVNAMRIELLEPARINNFTLNLVPQEPGYSGISISLPIKRRGAVIVPGDGTLNLIVGGVWSIEVKGATTTGELIPLATTITLADSGSPATTAVPSATTIVAP